MRKLAIVLAVVALTACKTVESINQAYSENMQALNEKVTAIAPPQVNEDYDKYTGETAYSAAISLQGFYDSNAYVIKNGDSRTSFIVLVSEQRGWVYLKYRDLTCLVDGERKAFPDVEWDGKILRHGDVREVMTWVMPLGYMETLGRSVDAECRIGHTEMRFTPRGKAALLALLDKSQNATNSQ